MNIYIRIVLFLIVAFLSGCSKLSLISIQILEPGGINIPAHVKKVALVDRSFPPQPGKKAVLGIFTGENILKERAETQQVLAGVNDALRNSIRLQCQLTNVQMIGSQNAGIFPPSLDSAVINHICREYKVDAVIALEDFSDNGSNSIAQKAVTIAETGIHNGVLNAIEKGIATAAQQPSVAQPSTIRLGFRLYDAKSNMICDQYSFTSSTNYTTDPQGNVINTYSTLQHTSYNAGMMYARRIAPSFMWVNRVFYRRSKNAQMGVASRMAITGDWKGASEIWMKLVNELSRKKAGRAAYNLALSYEVMGDLNQAQDWCGKAYAYYNNKQARNYAQILKQRVWELNRVQQQMHEQNQK